jgi:hypothetical protein
MRVADYSNPESIAHRAGRGAGGIGADQVPPDGVVLCIGDDNTLIITAENIALAEWASSDRGVPADLVVLGIHSQG